MAYNLTTEARIQLTSLAVGMFGAAPGSGVMADLAAAVEAGSTIRQIAANLTNTAEFKNMYPTYLAKEDLAKAMVNQIVGNEVIQSEKDLAVIELTARLNGGQSVADVFVDAIAAVDALESTNPLWGKAGVAFDNKVAVADYYTYDKQLGSTTLQELQNVIGAVTSDEATVTAAKLEVDDVQNPGNTFTFTVGVDDLKGGSGDDVFNATVTTTSAVLGALDVADGGTGDDTINIVDTATPASGAGSDLFLPTGLTIKNIENLNVTTNGALGTGVTTDFDVSTIAGLTSFTGAAAGDGTNTGSQVKAAGTTNVKLTVAGANTATVNGGQDVSIIAGTGATTIAGNATGTSSASIKGGGNTTVSGNSMKSVVLDGIAGGTAGITSNGVDAITVKNQTTVLATTLTNTTSTSLTVNVDKAGYTAAGAAVAGVSVAAGAAAATINLNATGGKSNVAVSGAVAKTLNITGSADLTLSAPIATATKIDGSAATGALALGTLNAATVNVATGSGKDSLQLSAVAKATVDTGAGNDTVTLGSAVAAGSTINLGAGDDKLLVAGGSVAASTTGNTTVIDGGDGIDSVAASLINAANASQFKNFENIDISSPTGTALDVELMTGSTITGLTLSGGAGGATVNKVAAGVGLSVAGNNAGTSTINVKDAATGTSDAFTVTFAGDAAATAPLAANVAAGTLVTEGVEALTIASNGGANTWNSAALTDAKLKTVTITGDKNLDLTFAGVNGTNPGATGGAVSSIDGSAATGKLNINTTSVTADNSAVGLTVKGGAAADTITLAQKATVNAGAGNDTIVVSSTGGTLTGDAGNDTFNVAAAVSTGNTEATALYTTVTDFTAGDKIAFAAGATTFNTTKVALGAAVTNLDLALQAAVTTANEVSWFQYGANTYVVADINGDNTLTAGDIAVKLTGLVDLSTSTLAANDLTFA